MKRLALLLPLLTLATYIVGCGLPADTIDLADLEHHADVIHKKVNDGTIVPDWFNRIPRSEIPTIRPGATPNFVEYFENAVYFDFGTHVAAEGYMVFNAEAVHSITSQPPIKIYRTIVVSPRTDRYIGEY